MLEFACRKAKVFKLPPIDHNFIPALESVLCDSLSHKVVMDGHR